MNRNMRGMVILSLLLQCFLILCAPLRRQKGGKWFVRVPLWIAYLLADWVATSTIALIFRAEQSDILTFWAPFLLLHLGGPDTVTSFSLEDNEFWIRHLLQLLLQVGSTIYIIILSHSNDRLWLPTLLVLIAGIIKYAERNRAFYLACFDQFGNNWEQESVFMPNVPAQFYGQLVRELQLNLERGQRIFIIEHKSTVAVYLLGAIKNLLVGPPLSSLQKWRIHTVIDERGSHEMLRIIEIDLSLLYELLHTKLPVVDSMIGYVCRIVNFGCILGALVSFSLLKKYFYVLGDPFDIWLTYWLLIGALALDLTSVILLLISHDWIVIAHSSKKKDSNQFIERNRWSKSVPQLNILTCRFKNKDGEYPFLFKLSHFSPIRNLFETIRRRIRCVSSKPFVEDQVWYFIFTTLQQKCAAGKEGIFHPGILHGDTHDIKFVWSLDKFEYMESLVIWHIATEICFQHGRGGTDNSSSSSNSASTSRRNFGGHRKICKLLSDYMFYLFVMEPAIIAASPNNLMKVFEGTAEWDHSWEWPYFIKGGKGATETFFKNLDKILVDQEAEKDMLLKKINSEVDKLPLKEKQEIEKFSRVTAACYLASELLKNEGGCPWELMGKYWVEIVCYAANSCQPIVHARQVSRGGQLLTLVWLLTNYLASTPPKDWYNVSERKEPEPAPAAADKKLVMKEHADQELARIRADPTFMTIWGHWERLRQFLDRNF